MTPYTALETLYSLHLELEAINSLLADLARDQPPHKFKTLRLHAELALSLSNELSAYIQHLAHTNSIQGGKP